MSAPKANEASGEFRIGNSNGVKAKQINPHAVLLASVRLQERYALTEAFRKVAIDAAESLIHRRQQSKLYGGKGGSVQMSDAELDAWIEQYTLENAPESILTTIREGRAVAATV